MPQLNLTANTKEEQKIKAYLEANASDILAEKMNNGARIQKDGKTLLNKKTLSGFMKYACDEAKKQAEKGAHSACIDDDVVYGWAVHYFEEDSMEGTLYNEDGTKYKKQPGVAAKAPIVKPAPPKPQQKPQLSMFDMLGDDNDSGISALKPYEDDDLQDDKELCEAIGQIATEEKAEQPKPAISPVYQKYLDVQGKYPQAIIAMRLGDFYEVFGKNAEMLANELPLTLTARDCGLESRVPMVGFPYHASDAYFKKILANGHAVVLIENDGARELPSAHTVDLETGEILSEEDMRESDGDVDEIPTVSSILSDYAAEQKPGSELAEDSADEPDCEDDFDISAFDTEAVANLSEIFGNEIELR